MVDLINSLIIDEDKEYSLTSYKKTKTGLKVQESDHYTLITNVNATWNKKTSVKRNEMYNIKDKEGLMRFKEIPGKDTSLYEVFDDEEKT